MQRLLVAALCFGLACKGESPKKLNPDDDLAKSLPTPEACEQGDVRACQRLIDQAPTPQETRTARGALGHAHELNCHKGMIESCMPAGEYFEKSGTGDAGRRRAAAAYRKACAAGDDSMDEPCYRAQRIEQFIGPPTTPKVKVLKKKVLKKDSE